LGEHFLKKLGDGLKSRGDRSAKALAKPTLLSQKAEIMATDFAITPTAGATLTPGEHLHVEHSPSDVRVIRGNRQVATVDNPGLFREVLAARGVAAAVVQECSAFGGASIRIREEQSHAP
jgi:hypothetical protein